MWRRDEDNVGWLLTGGEAKLAVRLAGLLVGQSTVRKRKIARERGRE